jgi:predicted DNA-binding protein
MSRIKIATSFRLSPEGLELLRALAERLGISQTAVLEMLIREKAEEKGLR